MNGGGIRGGKIYPAGLDLTRRDILSELPFGNRLVITSSTSAPSAPMAAGGPC
jgi:5'-nucleotidase/UDP-sugar diphosphatase